MVGNVRCGAARHRTLLVKETRKLPFSGEKNITLAAMFEGVDGGPQSHLALKFFHKSHLTLTLNR